MFKLSIINAKQSFKMYSIYLITLCLEIAFLTTLFAILQDEQFYNPRLYNNMFSVLFILVNIIIILVIFWLIGYTGKYILRLRSKEFALYMLSGIENKNINLLYSLEQSIIGVVALVCGLILGGIFYAILPKLVMSFLGLHYTIRFILPLSVIFKTTIWVFALYGFYILFGSLKLKKQKIIDLLQFAKQNEKIKNKKYALPLTIFFLFFMLFSYIQFLNEVKQGNFGNYFLFFLACFVIGIFEISYFLPAFILKVKTFGAKTYAFNVLNIKFSYYKLSEFAGKRALITLVLAVAVFLFNIGFMSVTFYLADKSGGILYDLELVHIQDSFDDENQLDFDLGITQLLAPLGVKNEARVAEYFDSNTQLQKAMDASNSNTIQRVITLTDYNQLRNMHGMPPYALQENECIFHIDYLVKYEHSDIEKKEYSVFQKKYLLKEVIVQDFRAVDTRFYVVVADTQIPATKKPAHLKHYWNLINTDPVQINETLLDICRKTNRHIGIVKTKSGQIIEVPDSEFMQKNDKIKNYKMSSAALMIASFYLGIIFLTITGQIIATSVTTDIYTNMQRYSLLTKLGLDQKAILQMIKQQLMSFFIIPFIIALFTGIGFNLTLIREYYIGGYLQFALKIILPQICLFTCIYFIYYIAVYKIYKKIILQVVK